MQYSATIMVFVVNGMSTLTGNAALLGSDRIRQITEVYGVLEPGSDALFSLEVTTQFGFFFILSQQLVNDKHECADGYGGVCHVEDGEIKKLHLEHILHVAEHHAVDEITHAARGDHHEAPA